MNIEYATQKLRIGEVVQYPADRGNPAGTASVAHIGETMCLNIHGTPYVWVTLAGAGVWPSHRIGWRTN